MRLKFWSLTPLDHQNMSKPIPHCSNFVKIVFWAWWGVFCIGSKNFFYKKVFYRSKEPDSRWVSPKSKICILSPMATQAFYITTPSKDISNYRVTFATEKCNRIVERIPQQQFWNMNTIVLQKTSLSCNTFRQQVHSYDSRLLLKWLNSASIKSTCLNIQ